MKTGIVYQKMEIFERDLCRPEIFFWYFLVGNRYAISHESFDFFFNSLIVAPNRAIPTYDFVAGECVYFLIRCQYPGYGSGVTMEEYSDGSIRYHLIFGNFEKKSIDLLG